MNLEPESESQLTSSIKVYRLKRSYRIPIFVMIGGVLLIALLLLLSPVVPIIKTKSASDVIGGIALSLGLAWGTYYVMNLYRLITSPQGIEYRCPEYKTYAAWSDLQQISDVAAGFPFRVDGIIVRQLAVQVQVPRRLRWYANIQAKDIPLAPFATDWRNSELGEDIKRCAPHLFNRHTDIIRPFTPTLPRN